MIVSNQHLTAERMLNHLEYEVHDCCQINCPFQSQVSEGQRSYALHFNNFFLDTFVCTMFNFSINFRVLLTIRTDSHSHNAGRSLFHLVSMRNALHFLPIATWAQCSLKEKKKGFLIQCVFFLHGPL